MSAQLFAKLSTKLYLNVKFREFADRHARAALVWIMAIAYSADVRSDGVIEEYALRRFLNATRRNVQELVDAGFLDPVGDGVWMIHDYLEMQVSSAEIESRREARSLAGKRGNERRWSDRKPIALAMDTVSQADRKPIADKDIDTDIDIDSSPLPPPGEDEVIENIPNNTVENIPNNVSENIPSNGFEQVWDTYPKHAGNKQRARQLYESVTDKPDVLTAARTLRDQVNKGEKDRRYIPTLENLLERQQYKDYLPARDSTLPSEAWMSERFQRALMPEERRRFFERIRDGDTWDVAAGKVDEWIGMNTPN